MMLLMSSTLQALSLSGDSFLAGLALGPWLIQRRACRLAAAFGVCDAAGSWLGGVGAPFGWALATMALLAAAIVLVLRERSWIVAVPVAMAADNFLQGGPASGIAAAGACSAMLALAGLAAGRRLALGVSPISSMGAR